MQTSQIARRAVGDSCKHQQILLFWKQIMRTVKNVRDEWDNAFKMMGEQGDDELLIDEKNISHSWDEGQCQWW